MQELLEKAATIALQAGELILAIKDKTASQKADGSPVTKADLEANAFITDRLSHIAPYPICSEEAPLEYEKRKDLEYFWLVDPLDGTKDFVANLSGWSVNIALIHRDKAILGVVYVPMLKELYLGLEGFGAFVGRGDSALGRHSGALSFGLESAIASSRGVDRPQVLSSLRDLQSPDSSSTILESKSVNKKQTQAQKSHREQVESKAQSPDSSPNDLAMLSKPFALAQSFEVAEHLDQQYALNFVKLLTSCADIVLFSAAIPYQGGVCHINEREPGYWAELFRQCGYECFDCLRPRIWSEESVLWWYRQNLLVFVHKDKVSSLPYDFLGNATSPLYMVHYAVWEERSKWLESLNIAHTDKPLFTALKLAVKWVLLKLHLLDRIKRLRAKRSQP